MSAIAATDTQHVGVPPCSTSFTHWLSQGHCREVVARAQQRMERARWISHEGLSAYEAACIPLDFYPSPEHFTHA